MSTVYYAVGAFRGGFWRMSNKTSCPLVLAVAAQVWVFISHPTEKQQQQTKTQDFAEDRTHVLRCTRRSFWLHWALAPCLNLKKRKAHKRAEDTLSGEIFINRWTAQMEVTAALQPAADNAVLIVLIFLWLFKWSAILLLFCEAWTCIVIMTIWEKDGRLLRLPIP